jgi:hypothetical protein
MPHSLPSAAMRAFPRGDPRTPPGFRSMRTAAAVCAGAAAVGAAVMTPVLAASSAVAPVHVRIYDLGADQLAGPSPSLYQLMLRARVGARLPSGSLFLFSRASAHPLVAGPAASRVSLVAGLPAGVCGPHLRGCRILGLPAGVVAVNHRQYLTPKPTSPYQLVWSLLRDRPAVTEADIAAAHQSVAAGAGTPPPPALVLDLTPAGQRAFSALTRTLAGRKPRLARHVNPTVTSPFHIMAVVANGRIISSSSVNQAEPTKGQAPATSIELALGDFTMAQVTDLVAGINAGLTSSK